MCQPRGVANMIDAPEGIISLEDGVRGTTLFLGNSIMFFLSFIYLHFSAIYTLTRDLLWALHYTRVLTENNRINLQPFWPYQLWDTFA